MIVEAVFSCFFLTEVINVGLDNWWMKYFRDQFLILHRKENKIPKLPSILSLQNSHRIFEDKT